MIVLKSGLVLVAGMSTGKSPILADGHWMLADAEAEASSAPSSSLTASLRSKAQTPKAPRQVGAKPRPPATLNATTKSEESGESVPSTSYSEADDCHWHLATQQSLHLSLGDLSESCPSRMEVASYPGSYASPESDLRSDRTTVDNDMQQSESVAYTVKQPDQSEWSWASRSSSPHSDWCLVDIATSVEAEIQPVGADWPTDAHVETAEYVASHMHDCRQHGALQLSATASPAYVAGASYHMGVYASMDFPASAMPTAPRYLHDHYEEQHFDRTAFYSESRTTQLCIDMGFQADDQTEHGGFALSHPVASFAQADVTRPFLSDAWPHSNVPVTTEACLPWDSSAFHAVQSLLRKRLEASELVGKHADVNRNHASPSLGVRPLYGRNNGMSGIAQDPVSQSMHGASRGIVGNDLYGLSGMINADAMLPKETLATTTTNIFTAIGHTDLMSNSLHCSPRFAAFCLGIDLFDSEDLPNLSNCSRDALYLASHLRQAVPRATSSVRNVVHCCNNVSRLEFESAFSDFESELAKLSASSETLELVVIFLASHGFQLESDIFVAFKDTHLGEAMHADSRRHMAETCIDVTQLIHRVKLRYSGPLAVILDTCRTSPIPKLALHLTSLANRSNFPSNTLVCFSTSAGGAAADGGPLQHSPFFLALIQKLTVAEMTIRSAIDAACNSLSQIQGSVCVTFQFQDICLVPKMLEVLVVGGPGYTELDVARQIGLLKSAQERQNGRGGRIVALGPRDGSIPADVLTHCTHADIPRFDLPLSNNDMATIVAMWDRLSSVTQPRLDSWMREATWTPIPRGSSDAVRGCQPCMSPKPSGSSASEPLHAHDLPRYGSPNRWTSSSARSATPTMQSSQATLHCSLSPSPSSASEAEPIATQAERSLSDEENPPLAFDACSPLQ